MNGRNQPEEATSRIQPLSTPQEIDRIRSLLHSKVRDLLLFDMAVETGLTAGQMLQLRINDLQGLQIGDKLPDHIGRACQDEPATVGPKTIETLNRYLEELAPNGEDFLFKSRKGTGPLSITSASRMVSSWFKDAGLEGKRGFLCLRKTWEMYRRLEVSIQQSPDAMEATPNSYSVNSIKTPTTQELAYKELEQAIVTARIKPGQKLVTEVLAKQMGVSRIPVREAIGRLAARNFVTVQPKKGATVNELSEKNLEEILKIRLMLETSAAREATSRHNKHILNRLEKLTKDYLRAHQNQDAKGLLHANQKFHFTIYRQAQMPIMLAMIENLWKQVSPYYHIMFRQTSFNDPQTGPDYHRKMIEGLRKRDPQEVSHWLETDLVESTQFVIRVMKTMNLQ